MVNGPCEKLQIPSTKLQRSSKLQAPTGTRAFWSLVLGVSLELGAWDLELLPFFRPSVGITPNNPGVISAGDQENGSTRLPGNFKHQLQRMPNARRGLELEVWCLGFGASLERSRRRYPQTVIRQLHARRQLGLGRVVVVIVGQVREIRLPGRDPPGGGEGLVEAHVGRVRLPAQGVED